MKNFLRVCGVAVVVLMGCGGPSTPSACDKSDAIDLNKVAGDCTGLDLSKPLGTKAVCADKLKPCTTSEQDTLAKIVTCLENLEVCSAASKQKFLDRQGACYASVSSLSTTCKDSVFGMTIIPGMDAGFDAGPPPDAGRQPSDGTGVVDLIGVADESVFALAWNTRQRGPVAKWELNVFGEDGGRLPEQYLTPGALRAYELAAPKSDGGVDAGAAGVTRAYFVAGVDNLFALVYGDPPDAGTPVVSDAGQMCMTGIDCPTDKVCDLGTCKSQTCQAGGPATCPVGYTCAPGPMTCLRQFSDAGMLDAGVVDAGVFVPSPLLSNRITLTTGAPGFSAETPVGGFVARKLDLVAMDTARQFVALEQETQLFGHFSTARGKDLVNDFGTTSPIDPAGSRAKLAYVPQSDTVYACYNFGRGIRIRRSRDLGHSWGLDAVTITPEEDGGFSSRFSDCAIAPWKNGQAIFSYVKDDSIVVQTVDDQLVVPPETPSDTVFTSTGADAGNVYNPRNLTMATLPGTTLDGGPGSIVQVLFTATRSVGAQADTEIYGLYRDGTTASFLGPLLVNKSVTGGSGDPQDYATVLVDPKTGKSLAAYTSYELGMYSTVYLSLFSPTTKSWITGSDLTVFAKKLTEFPVFPAKTQADVWDAFSPSLAAQKNGKLWLSVVAGKRNGAGIRDLQMYLVGFDFDATSPIAGKGWFLPPGIKMSNTKVLDPRTATNVVPPNVSAICTDNQISVYGAFIEGIGAMNEQENRAVFVSRP